MSFYRKTFDILLKKYKFLRLTWHFELLFNSLDTLQTKPLPPIRHICDFSRGVLNVRFMRSHPTLAPRPQICLIGGNGFCAVAGEDELNRGRGFGDRSWCLLLTLEWLGIEGWVGFFNDYHINISIISEQETGFYSQSQFFNKSI